MEDLKALQAILDSKLAATAKSVLLSDESKPLIWSADMNHHSISDIQTIVDLRAEIAELKAQQLKDDLLVMSNARRLIKAKAITSNGRLYMELFGTGMGTARDRCRNLGLDPDDNKTSFTLARSKAND